MEIDKQKDESSKVFKGEEEKKMKKLVNFPTWAV